jgi:hypothetical protein
MGPCHEATDELLVLIRRGRLYFMSLCHDCADRLEGLAGRSLPWAASRALDKYANDGTSAEPVAVRGRMHQPRSRAARLPSSALG